MASQQTDSFEAESGGLHFQPSPKNPVQWLNVIFKERALIYDIKTEILTKVQKDLVSRGIEPMIFFPHV